MLPLIGLGVVLARAFTAALTVYELYSYGSNLYEGQTNYRQELEKADPRQYRGQQIPLNS